MGTLVTDYLLAKGFSVRVYSRGASRASISPGATAFDGDICDAASLSNALKGVEAVVHLVGILRESPPTQSFERVFLHGTRVLVQAAQRAGIQRFVHVTGIGANADSPEPFERMRGLAENETRESELDWVIIRPSVIFGVRNGMLDRIARSPRGTWPFAIMPRHDGLYQPLWRDDAAHCISLALTDRSLLGGTYELGGPDIWTYSALVRLAMRQLGLKRILLRLPTPFLLAGAALPRAAGRSALITASELRQLTRDNRTDSSTLSTSFGITPTRLTDRLNEAFAR